MNSLTQNVSCIKKKKSYGYDKKFPQSSYRLLFYICVLITELDSVVCISQRSWNFLRGIGFSYFFIFKTYFALGRGKIALVHWRFCVLAGFFFFFKWLERNKRIFEEAIQNRDGHTSVWFSSGGNRTKQFCNQFGLLLPKQNISCCK